MSLAAWSARHFALLWLGALALAAALIGAEWLRWLKRPAFFWLLPYPGTPRAVALLARGLVVAAPFAAGALVVLLLALAARLAWVAARLARAA